MKFHLIASVPIQLGVATCVRVPRYSGLSGPEVARVGGAQVLIQRIGVGAVHVDLGEDREGHRVVRRAEVLNLGVGAGLLATELVAREAEHLKARAAELLLQRLEPFVLGREPALAGDVDQQQDLPA